MVRLSHPVKDPRLLVTSREMYCLEHGIGPDGCNIQEHEGDIGIPGTFFSETGDTCTKYIPRAIYIDLEPSVIDQV